MVIPTTCGFSTGLIQSITCKINDLVSTGISADVDDCSCSTILSDYKIPILLISIVRISTNG